MFICVCIDVCVYKRYMWIVDVFVCIHVCMYVCSYIFTCVCVFFLPVCLYVYEAHYIILMNKMWLYVRKCGK